MGRLLDELLVGVTEGFGYVVIADGEALGLRIAEIGDLDTPVAEIDVTHSLTENNREIIIAQLAQAISQEITVHFNGTSALLGSLFTSAGRKQVRDIFLVDPVIPDPNGVPQSPFTTQLPQGRMGVTGKAIPLDDNVSTATISIGGGTASPVYTLQQDDVAPTAVALVDNGLVATTTPIGSYKGDLSATYAINGPLLFELVLDTGTPALSADNDKFAVQGLKLVNTVALTTTGSDTGDGAYQVTVRAWTVTGYNDFNVALSDDGGFTITQLA